MLRQELKVSQQSAFAEGTINNLCTIWKSYLLFTLYFGFACMPASVETIMLVAQFLRRSCVNVNGIRNYISGVKLLHVLSGFSEFMFNHDHLKLALCGIERNMAYTPKLSLPITIGVGSRHAYIA